MNVNFSPRNFEIKINLWRRFQQGHNHTTRKHTFELKIYPITLAVWSRGFYMVKFIKSSRIWRGENNNKL